MLCSHENGVLNPFNVLLPVAGGAEIHLLKFKPFNLILFINLFFVQIMTIHTAGKV